MAKHEKADQARKGLIDSVKGKAKELSVLSPGTIR